MPEKNTIKVKIENQNNPSSFNTAGAVILGVKTYRTAIYDFAKSLMADSTPKIGKQVG